MSCIGRLALRHVTTGLALVFMAAQSAAAPIGEATAAKNDVTGQLGPVAQRIAVGTNISSDETVRTGRSSSTELRFLDNSTLTIGAQSVVVLDRHIYDPNRGSVDTLVNLSKGALRFVSAGNRTRNATISTPVATIGIRGTALVITCTDEDTCATVIDDGRARICPVPSGTQVTRELRNACLRGNKALLPCGFYDITAKDQQRRNSEGNFMIVSRGCVFAAPVNVDPSAFNFLQQQIAAGAPMPDPSIISSTTFASAPTTAVPGAATGATASGATATATTATAVAVPAGAMTAAAAAVFAAPVTLETEPVSW